jgi:hypothetical protein
MALAPDVAPGPLGTLTATSPTAVVTALAALTRRDARFVLFLHRVVRAFVIDGIDDFQVRRNLRVGIGKNILESRIVRLDGILHALVRVSLQRCRIACGKE